MKPQIVFALYRPHDGKESEFLELLTDHVPTLRRLELITERAPVVCRAKNGTIIEVFEWADTGSSAQAHQHPEIAAIWEKMGEIADLPALDTLDEVSNRFPHFEPIAT